MCYNFLNILRIEGTVFQVFMGEMKNIPLFGFQFQSYFPPILCLFALFNYFSIWSWITKLLGANSIGFMEPFTAEKAMQG